MRQNELKMWEGTKERRKTVEIALAISLTGTTATTTAGAVLSWLQRIWRWIAE